MNLMVKKRQRFLIRVTKKRVTFLLCESSSTSLYPAMLHAVTHWDIDSVLLPLEAAIGGFSDRVIPAARERGIGIIGMKTLGAGNYIRPGSGLSPEALIRFALSQDVDLVIVGCSTAGEARLLARIDQEHTAMSEEAQAQLIETVRPYAHRLAYYRGVI
jgi:hypothetical protein